MSTKPPPFSPSVFDEEMGVFVSPEELPYYEGEGPLFEIDAAYEVISSDVTPDEFYRAIGTLFFHSRHLMPHQHADLARIVSTPYVRSFGKPRNFKLEAIANDFAEHSILFRGMTRQEFVRMAVKEFGTSKAVVLRALREAEKRASEQKS